MLAAKKLSAATAAAPKLYVEDVFSTWLYDGNGSSQTITNGIDLSGQGGMVWFKCRSNAFDNLIFDTARGTEDGLVTNSTASQGSYPSALSSYNSNGFTLQGSVAETNDNNLIYTSWTFRKAAKFFDVVTYTGTGVARTVSHNLGSVPGCIIVKCTSDGATAWRVYHRSLGATKRLNLHLTAAEETQSGTWNNTEPTSTVFTVGTDSSVNTNGSTYVAYLFAHDAGGFGDAGDQSVIKCGSYVGDGTSATVNLGWEPQWILIKKSSSAGAVPDWHIYNNMSGIPTGGNDSYLRANLSDAEIGSVNNVELTATGFTVNANIAISSETYIYIAIRRGPMKTPTDATKVFTPTVYTGTNVDNRLINTTIDPDFVMIRQRNDTVVPGMYTGARLTGQQFLITGSSNAGATDADSFDAQIVSTVEYGNAFSSMSGVWVGNDATRKFNANTTSNNHVIEAFKRAPGFFDVVCYTGTGSATTVSHNLGVAPEMIIVRSRDLSTTDWIVYHTALGATKYIFLNAINQEATSSSFWNDTAPTSSVFSVGISNNVNGSNYGHIALLFASCPGVSKVGSYTGTGTTLSIDCGFTAGARFVLIKRRDSNADWWLWDSARGITTGNDPFLKINTTSAEATDDYIDPYNQGFQLSSTAPTAINENGGTYIYLAIA